MMVKVIQFNSLWSFNLHSNKLWIGSIYDQKDKQPLEESKKICMKSNSHYSDNISSYTFQRRQNANHKECSIWVFVTCINSYLYITIAITINKQNRPCSSFKCRQYGDSNCSMRWGGLQYPFPPILISPLNYNESNLFWFFLFHIHSLSNDLCYLL